MDQAMYLLCKTGNHWLPGSETIPHRPRLELSTNLIQKIYRNGIKLTLILVPGGQYMVGCCPLARQLGVWDLGYLSSADCKLIASVESSGDFVGFQATPDGIGLVILMLHQ